MAIDCGDQGRQRHGEKDLVEEALLGALETRLGRGLGGRRIGLTGRVVDARRGQRRLEIVMDRP